jgi:hypothetical protein
MPEQGPFVTLTGSPGEVASRILRQAMDHQCQRHRGAFCAEGITQAVLAVIAAEPLAKPREVQP